MAAIRKRNGKYQVQVRRQGSSPIAKSFIKLTDAREWARMMEVSADRQELAPRRSELAAITLADLITRYRDNETPRKKGATTERIMLNAFLRHAISRKPLSSLTQSDFAAYRDERLAAVKPASIRRQLMTVRAVLSKAMTDWNVPLRNNPMAGLKLPAQENKRQRRLSPKEWERIMRAERQDTNPLTLLIARFCLETAMRRGEVLALKWLDVDLERSTAIIREAKSGEGRVVPLTQGAVHVLLEVADLPASTSKAATDPVFPITTITLHASWRGLVSRAGIVDLRFHDLRHEAISRLFELGLTAPEVATISGHRTVAQLFRYAHDAGHQRLAARI